MMCPKCKRPLFCVNSRQLDNETIRYREYRCRVCGEKMYTVETITDMAYGRQHINQIISKKKGGELV